MKSSDFFGYSLPYLLPHSRLNHLIVSHTICIVKKNLLLSFPKIQPTHLRTKKERQLPIVLRQRKNLPIPDISATYPIAIVSSKSRFLIDFKDCTLIFSKSKFCFLNLKYSSILHLIRYTLHIAVKIRLSSLFRLVISIIGILPKP